MVPFLTAVVERVSVLQHTMNTGERTSKVEGDTEGSAELVVASVALAD